MNLWRELAIGPNAPTLIPIIIEIPSDTRNKYELDHEMGIMRLNRVLASPLHYPADYGLIPQTIYEDGDPLDALVMIKEPTLNSSYLIPRTDKQIGATSIRRGFSGSWYPPHSPAKSKGESESSACSEPCDPPPA